MHKLGTTSAAYAYLPVSFTVSQNNERQDIHRPAWPFLKHCRENDASKPVLLLSFRTLSRPIPFERPSNRELSSPCHDANNKAYQTPSVIVNRLLTSFPPERQVFFQEG